MGTTSTDSVKYIGNDYLDLGIKSGMLLTEVNEILFSHYTQSLKAQNEFNEQVNLSPKSSNIAVDEYSITQKGKWAGTLAISTQKGNIDVVINVDLSTFYNSIGDSVLSVTTEAYGTPNTGGRTLLFSSDKQIFTQTVSVDRFPIYGTSTVRVLEAGGDVTYIANFTIGSANIRNYTFDFVGQGLGTQGLKTQSDFNTAVLDKINELSNIVGNQEVELDGVLYNSWQQCCSALLGQCNSLQQQINSLNSGNNTTKTAANCGEQLTTSGCIDC